jgi:hypothetical protein
MARPIVGAGSRATSSPSVVLSPAPEARPQESLLLANQRSLRTRQLEKDVNRRVQRLGYQHCRQDDGVRLRREAPKVLADIRDVLSGN